MTRRGCFAGSAAVLLMASMADAAGQRIDLRDCPLDTVVFVDPWAGGTFKVKRVGTDYSYLCEDETKPPDDTCRGPYGDLVLEGEYSDSEDAPGQTLYARYNVIPAVPCCDWNVHKPEEMQFGVGFKWLAGKDVPLLKQQPWLSIDSVNFGSDFGNPLYAVSCTLSK